MRYFNKNGKNKNEKEQRDLNRMKLYQKLSEKTVFRKWPKSHRIRN